MILAPNPQQPLSGSNRIAILFLPLLFFSCGAFKKVPETLPNTIPNSDTVLVVNDPVMNDTSSHVPITDEVEEAYQTVYFRGFEFKVPLHSSDFNIALILPFHTGLKTAQEERRASYMLEYYQGVNVALKALEDLNSKYKIHVYDSENDTLVLKRILRKAEMKKMDLIIGPTDEVQVRIAAYFAQKNEIPLFSPVTVIDKSWSSNPYLFNMMPSDEIKAKEFIEFYKAKHPKKKLVIVRDASYFDKGFGQAVVNLLNAQTAIHYEVVKFNKSTNWGAYIKDGEYIVLHTTEDKNNMNATVTSLMKYKDKVSLFGSEKWLDFSSVDYSFWNQLNVHFIASDLAEQGTAQSIQMKRAYRNMYNGDPSSFAYMGYDQMLFASELLNAFGKYFTLFIQDKTFEYSNTRFTMTNHNNCYQNKFIEILNFKDSKLISVSSNQ